MLQSVQSKISIDALETFQTQCCKLYAYITLKSQCISLISTAICIRWLGFSGYIILKILESRIHITNFRIRFL